MGTCSNFGTFSRKRIHGNLFKLWYYVLNAIEKFIPNFYQFISDWWEYFGLIWQELYYSTQLLVQQLLQTSIKTLDESTARRQLKSPQSLPGRSIHLTLVTKWSWSWSWMTDCHLLCAMSISPPILRYYFKIWPWKSMVKVICVVKGQGHIWPSKFKGQG